MRNLRREVVGNMHFNGSVDVTDPCYNRDVWCRINDLQIKPGNYECDLWMEKESYTWNGKKEEYEIVRVIGIYLDGIVPEQSEMAEIGEIGVDAGLAGFFHNKPDFTDEEWRDLCNKIHNKDYYLDDALGFFSTSGDGDGGYLVYAGYTGREITSLEIRF